MDELSQKPVKLKSKIWLSVMFSTAVLAIIVYLADIQNVLNTLKNGKPLLILLALLTSNIPILIYAFTWKEVFNMSGINLKYFNSLRVVLANVFINNITPFGNIGGEAALTYLISRVTDYKAGKIFSPIFMSSIINFSPLGSLLLIGLLFNGQTRLIMVLLLFLGIALVFRKKFYREKYLPGFISKKTPERILEFIQNFREASKKLLDHKSRLLVLLGLSHFAIIFDVLSIIIIAESFGGNLISPLILLVIPLARIANYFPTPGGSGSYEAIMIGLLTFYMGMSTAAAVSTVLTYRGLTYYFGLMIGYLALNSIGIDENFLNQEQKKDSKQ